MVQINTPCFLCFVKYMVLSYLFSYYMRITTTSKLFISKNIICLFLFEYRSTLLFFTHISYLLHLLLFIYNDKLNNIPRKICFCIFLFFFKLLIIIKNSIYFLFYLSNDKEIVFPLIKIVQGEQTLPM